jgi:hypothetical protein
MNGGSVGALGLCLCCNIRNIGFGCGTCGKGICTDCNLKIRYDISMQLESTHCRHCSTNFDKFCALCRRYIIQQQDDEQKRQKEQPPSYPSLDSITIDYIREKCCFKVCRCNERCKCRDTSVQIIKKKYEIQNLVFDAYSLKCETC